jgi:hypothetical protein
VAVLEAQGTRLQWLDWVGPPQRLGACLAACVAQARAQGATELWGWASEAVLQAVDAALPEALRPLRSETARIGVPITSVLGAGDLAGMRGWWHGADTDFL